VAYRLATIPMILNDVEGHSPIASFLKMVFFVQLFSHDMISTDSVDARSLDPSTIAELQLLVIRSVGVAFTFPFYWY